MKYLLMFLIKCYWLIPKSYRRHCIFKETCSHHVYNATQSKGFKHGLHALENRYKQCRTGYAFFKIKEEEFVLLADGSIVKRLITQV